MNDNAEKMSQKTRTFDDPASRLRAGLPGAFFRPSQVEEAGVTRHQLRSLVRRGVVEHVARGLYRFADAEPTEHYSIAMVCARVPRSIVCLLSALSVHEIGTQLTPAVWLAIPHKAEPPRVPGIKIRLLRFSGAAWSYGIQAIEFEGVPARITSPARTIVDCFRFERLIGREAALEALHDALRQRKVSTDSLMRTMKVLPNRRLRAALESVAP
jgi:predicted transcriptional regulator of viral defense system